MLLLTKSDQTVPVSLSFITTERIDDIVRFHWQTATETANAGFNLLVETEQGLQQLNPSLIPSQAIHSLEPLDYRYEAATAAERFYLHQIGTDGSTETFGPYAIGQTYGVYTNIPQSSNDAGPAIYLPIAR